MRVEAIGGPHDGKTIRVEDGMRVLAVPRPENLLRWVRAGLDLSAHGDGGRFGLGPVYYQIEPHPLTPGRGAIYGPLYWPGAE
jgi:hypothetical protein